MQFPPLCQLYYPGFAVVVVFGVALFGTAICSNIAHQYGDPRTKTTFSFFILVSQKSSRALLCSAWNRANSHSIYECLCLFWNSSLWSHLDVEEYLELIGFKPSIPYFLLFSPVRIVYTNAAENVCKRRLLAVRVQNNRVFSNSTNSIPRSFKPSTNTSFIYFRIISVLIWTIVAWKELAESSFLKNYFLPGHDWEILRVCCVQLYVVRMEQTETFWSANVII